MTRKPKVLLLAGLAVLAMSAIGATSALATFTTQHTAATAFTNVEGGNTVLTSEPDGTGTTAHHVFDVPGNGAITCNSVDGEATVSGGPTLLSIRVKGKGATPATGCTFLGQPATLELNGCEGEARPSSTATIICEAGKEITFSAAGCTLHVPPQHLTEVHAGFRNLGAGGNDMYITGEGSATNIKLTATGAGCITVGTFTTGRYTTGNTIVKGEVDPPNTPNATQKAVTVH